MPQFYVYVYRDPSKKNEPIYVGKGQGRRARDHLTRKDVHPFTQRLQLMKRNGIEPDIEIINAIDEDHAYFMEECCIQVLGRKDLGKGSLLNLNDGGKGGMSNPSVEIRQRMSDTMKGNKNMLGKSHSQKTRQQQSDAKKGENHPMYGKSPSDETRKKQSDAMKGENNPRFGISPPNKGLPRLRVICPHCEKEGGEGIMHRWHFDNCKYKK